MQNLSYFKTTLILLLLFFSSKGQSQSYFKAGVESNKYKNQKVQRFSNQDILIIDSSLEALETGEETGEITMRRLDACGNQVFSKAFIYTEGYLEFADFKISSNDEVFVYGSIYQGLQERIFLAKFDGMSGANIKFIILNTGTVDHFSYSIDVKNGQVQLYGLIFDFNTAKLGFVTAFDENLNYQYGVQFSPFESTGNACITNDNSFLGWSGDFFIKLTNDGALEWAKKLNTSSDIFLVNGPFEVPGGYIFESNRGDQSFFFKLDVSGNLVWKSDQFKANRYGAALSLLDDGNIICTYNYPMGNISDLCQMKITPNGELFDQHSLFFEHTFNTGTLYQSLDQNNYLTLAGNSNPITIGAVDVKDFLFQFSLDSLTENCWSWDSFEETFPNTISLDINPYTVDLQPANMTVESTTSLDASSFSFSVDELCEEQPEPMLLQKDTLLPCGENWEVLLPGVGFEWVDNYPGNQRTIETPGTYQARKLSCSEPEIIEYTLTKSNCGCKVFLPNIFSPNFDGANDYLNIFSDCTIDKIEISIFNRWGATVFYSNNPNQFWDGSFKGKDMPNGVYIAILHYEFTDLDGSIQQGTLTQDVTIVR